MTPARRDELNLKQAASVLGVHYMTAYRYVRTGQLPARRDGNIWVLDGNDVAALAELKARSGETPVGVEEGREADWRARLRQRLVIGDETGAWRVLEQALAAGHEPVDCYLDLLVGAINDISGRAALPSAPVAEEYLATATATRLVGRLGARFRRSGRSRGTVVFGAPLGEHHTLAIAVVADLIRLEGFTCLELGADVPPAAFAAAASGAYRLVAVGVGIASPASFESLRSTVEAVRGVDESIPVVIGGQAATQEMAGAAGATAWAGDGRRAMEVFKRFEKSRRVVWLLAEADARELSPADRQLEYGTH